MPKMKLPTILITLVLILLISSCNMPRGLSPEQQTAIAQTVAAENQGPTDTTEPGSAPASDTPDPGAPASDTPEPSDTPELDTPTPSDTPIPCNQADFVKDVNVPDGKVFDPGEDFTKTWRLKNIGSCSWTSGYDIVFDGGDSMDGPSSVQLTSGTVDPGETVDVSVDLTAPDDPGTYQGNWKLRDSSDVIFGIDTAKGIFWVKIKVVKPEETKKITWASRGQVYSDGTTGAPSNVGDNTTDKGLQGFITYDLSSLPNNAEITEVKFKYSDYDILGDPFSVLGCLRVYEDDYGALGPGDYTPPPVSDHINKFCSEADLSNATVQLFNSKGLEAINDALPTDEFQIRLQFNELETNGDGISDAVRGDFDLVITYR